MIGVVTSAIDLPRVQEGDFGWCIYDGMGEGPCRLVYYDDDDFWCSHMFDDDLDHRCGDGSGDGCFLDSGAIVHATELCDGNCETVPYSSLRPVPACIRAEGVVSRRDGWVYAVAVVPEVDLRRLKVGYTESPIHQRMAAYRTANPTAILLGLWEGDRFDERRSHAALGGRIGRSEVFQVADLRSALSKLDAALAQYVTGSEV